MAGQYARYYIPIGGTLLSLFVALSLIGIEITADGDKECDGTIEDPCISYITLSNPTAKNVYIYNKEDVTLQFSPDIESYELYHKYYGKWRKLDFTMENRPGNIPEGAAYVYLLPRYGKKEWMLKGYKNNPSDVVKWTLGVPGDILDPVWDAKDVGDKIKLKEETHYVDYNITVNNPYLVNTSVNYTCFDWTCVSNGTSPTPTQCNTTFSCPANNECSAQPYTCIRYEMVKHDNYTEETRQRAVGFDQLIEINGVGFNATANLLYCKKDSHKPKGIVCDSILDGNGDGICQSGESCLIYSENTTNALYEVRDFYTPLYEKDMKGYDIKEKKEVSI